MIPSLKTVRNFLPEFLARLTLRRDSGAIDSSESLRRFVSTRAAFIAQKTLYGYVKTRMGTRYPSMFEDDTIIASINIAKMHVYEACLSDLSIFAASRALRSGGIDDALRRDLAVACYRQGLQDNAEQAAGAETFDPGAAEKAFERRLAFWDWQAGPAGVDIFTASPAALFRWAPIAPELKKFDQEIVENSIRYAWRDVRVQLEKRIDSAALTADADHRAKKTA